MLDAVELDDAVEVTATRQAGGIPPGGRGIVGHRHEGAAHSLRADADAFVDLGAGRRWRQHEEQQGHNGHKGKLYLGVLRVLCVGRTERQGQSTNTAAATTVVHSPFLSPMAVWVTFCVRTICFDNL